jgi:hypothetical protein
MTVGKDANNIKMHSLENGDFLFPTMLLSCGDYCWYFSSRLPDTNIQLKLEANREPVQEGLMV